jgi:hypothetical protein
MNGIGKQVFVVIERATVVGSFMTLRDALEFKTKSATRTARIVADHGEFDSIPCRGATTYAVWTPGFDDQSR